MQQFCAPSSDRPGRPARRKRRWGPLHRKAEQAFLPGCRHRSAASAPRQCLDPTGRQPAPYDGSRTAGLTFSVMRSISPPRTTRPMSASQAQWRRSRREGEGNSSGWPASSAPRRAEPRTPGCRPGTPPPKRSSRNGGRDNLQTHSEGRRRHRPDRRRRAYPPGEPHLILRVFRGEAGKPRRQPFRRKGRHRADPQRRGPGPDD